MVNIKPESSSAQSFIQGKNVILCLITGKCMREKGYLVQASVSGLSCM